MALTFIDERRGERQATSRSFRLQRFASADAGVQDRVGLARHLEPRLAIAGLREQAGDRRPVHRPGAHELLQRRPSADLERLDALGELSGSEAPQVRRRPPPPIDRHQAGFEEHDVEDRARRDGYALVDQELEEGLRSIAVPIRDGSGAVVAAMNLSTHAARRSVASMRSELLPALRETAARIEADLAAAPATHRRAT